MTLTSEKMMAGFRWSARVLAAVGILVIVIIKLTGPMNIDVLGSWARYATAHYDPLGIGLFSYWQHRPLGFELIQHSLIFLSTYFGGAFEYGVWNALVLLMVAGCSALFAGRFSNFLFAFTVTFAVLTGVSIYIWGQPEFLAACFAIAAFGAFPRSRTLYFLLLSLCFLMKLTTGLIALAIFLWCDQLSLKRVSGFFAVCGISLLLMCQLSPFEWNGLMIGTIIEGNFDRGLFARVQNVFANIRNFWFDYPLAVVISVALLPFLRLKRREAVLLVIAILCALGSCFVQGMPFNYQVAGLLIVPPLLLYIASVRRVSFGEFSPRMKLTAISLWIAAAMGGVLGIENLQFENNRERTWQEPIAAWASSVREKLQLQSVDRAVYLTPVFIAGIYRIPSSCRQIFAVAIQRTQDPKVFERVKDNPVYGEEYGCLAQGNAKVLFWDSRWMPLKQMAEPERMANVLAGYTRRNDLSFWPYKVFVK